MSELIEERNLPDLIGDSSLLYRSISNADFVRAVCSSRVVSSGARDRAFRNSCACGISTVICVIELFSFYQESSSGTNPRQSCLTTTSFLYAIPPKVQFSISCTLYTTLSIVSSSV